MRLRSAIAAVPPYRQGRPAPADGFKLSSNENPFPPLPGVLRAIGRAAESINRYPDATAARLREALGDILGVASDRILVSDGSVSAIAQLIQAAAGEGDEVVYAWRSFEAYPLLVTVAGATAVEVPLTPDHRHDLDAMAAAITERTRVVIVCSPNNPTSTLVTQREFDDFVAKVPDDVLIMLDEAYIEFVRHDTAIDGIAAQQEHDNVVVLRTFSKAYGLAGLRVGYVIGDPAILHGARVTGIPLSVTSLGVAAAVESLRLQGELLARVEELADRRDDLWRALVDAGTPVPEPHGNFIWLPADERQAADIEAVLERHGLVARQFADGVRVSVGEPESVARVLAAAADIRELA